MVSSVQLDEILGDRYRIIRVLRQNAFGSTALVEDLTQDNQAHILQELKLPSQDPRLIDRARELLTPEVEFLKRLHHPQIPQFHDFFELQREQSLSFCVVHTFVEGMTLRQVLEHRQQENRPLTALEAMRLLQQLLPVLDYLHNQGVIHRNLSPDTILWRRQDARLVLIEFGGLLQGMTTLWTERQDVTTLGAAADLPRVGQLGYAPPEQVQKGIVYTYTDLYALGATVLMALTGQEPLALFDVERGQWRWQEVEVEHPVLLTLLQGMLAQKIHDRPHSAQSVLQTLRRALQAMPAPATTNPSEFVAPPVNPPRRGLWLRSLGGWLWRGGVAIAVVAVAGVGGWLIGQTWLDYQVRTASPAGSAAEPDLDLSPEVAPLPTESAALNFPPIDDDQPEPSADLPDAERDRKLELRRQRRELVIDYDFFEALVDYRYGQENPDRQGVRLTPESGDQLWRDRRDVVAQQMLDQLRELSGEARRRLGAYGRDDRRQWAQRLQQRNLTLAPVELLTNTVFSLYFPQDEPDQEPLDQVWSAIAFDHVRALEVGETLIPLSPTIGTELRHSGSLEPWQGKVFTVSLEAGQSLTANGVSDYPTLVGMYDPSGRSLLENDNDRTWSGQVSQSGYYTIAIVSNAPQTVNYNLYLTVNDAP